MCGPKRKGVKKECRRYILALYMIEREDNKQCKKHTKDLKLKLTIVND